MQKEVTYRPAGCFNAKGEDKFRPWFDINTFSFMLFEEGNVSFVSCHNDELLKKRKERENEKER